MQIKNRLAVLMAEREIKSVSELHRRIKESGMTMSRRTLDKFINNESNRIDYDTITTLCTILSCDIGDLFVLVEEEDKD